jgi:hypothetical protein
MIFIQSMWMNSIHADCILLLFYFNITVHIFFFNIKTQPMWILFIHTGCMNIITPINIYPTFITK